MVTVLCSIIPYSVIFSLIHKAWFLILLPRLLFLWDLVTVIIKESSLPETTCHAFGTIAVKKSHVVVHVDAK